MSPTDDSIADDLIKHVFFDGLMPLAAKLRLDVARTPLIEDSKEQDTYFQRKANQSASPEDFEAVTYQSVEELKQQLRDLWEKQGFSELAELAPTFARIAELLRPTEKQDEEVSPFLYVMF